MCAAAAGGVQHMKSLRVVHAILHFVSLCVCPVKDTTRLSMYIIIIIYTMVSYK